MALQSGTEHMFTLKQGKEAYRCRNLHHCAVMSLEYVLVDVLHRLDSGAHFHIDVGIVFLGKVRVVGNHPAVVKLVATSGDCSAILTPAACSS